jgi:TetR/AcrR family transcriptional regulator, mexJK operon transcriptional repressor
LPLSDDQILKMKEKRIKILEEAIKLFAEFGYDGTSVKQVANAAGVSFGSVFTYFEKKEELFHCAVVEPLEDFSFQLLNFDPNAKDVLTELEKMITNQIKTYASFGTYLNLVVQVVGHPNRFMDTFTILDEFHKQFRAKLKNLIENGQKQGQLTVQDPMYVATSYTSLLMGLRVNLTDEAESHIWGKFVPFAMQLFGPKRN